MLKNATYQEKFQLLSPWMDEIVEEVKKDLKNDHLKKDWGFAKKYLPSKNIQKVTCDDLAAAYRNAIAAEENGEAIGEFIASRWLLKNSEVYQYFEEELSKITKDFSSLEVLSNEQSLRILEEAIVRFGAIKTYLFSVLNSVVFPEEQYQQLGKRAEKQSKEQEAQSAAELQQLSLDQQFKAHEREMARLADKYEKKLQGLQKKYLIDVENLKKQIAQLQKKLNESKV